jgi:hypothetical protein
MDKPTQFFPSIDQLLASLTPRTVWSTAFTPSDPYLTVLSRSLLVRMVREQLAFEAAIDPALLTEEQRAVVAEQQQRLAQFVVDLEALPTDDVPLAMYPVTTDGEALEESTPW